MITCLETFFLIKRSYVRYDSTKHEYNYTNLYMQTYFILRYTRSSALCKIIFFYLNFFNKNIKTMSLLNIYRLIKSLEKK